MTWLTLTKYNDWPGSYYATSVPPAIYIFNNSIHVDGPAVRNNIEVCFIAPFLLWVSLTSGVIPNNACG